MTVIQSQDSAGLFERFRLGAISLKHRVVMAPMTRLRAGKDDGIPSEWAEEYYSSRATATRSIHSYGGSIDNRIRFPIEILKSVTLVIPPQKVGLRISPFGTYQGMREPIGEESGPIKTFSRLLEKLYEEIPDFGYIHALEPRSTGDGDQSDDKLNLKDSIDPLRQIVLKHGSQFIVAGGYTPASAKVHGEKYNELIAFGRSFTSNPDLVERIKKELPLTKYDRSTFYTQGKEGYLGWSTYQKQDVAGSAVEAKIDVEASAIEVAA
ncbi:uncharacterized protein L199_001579 [Kwoniella botswanensis]|uniref:uncharacterized protein n=1 Tax=Kwoniella botswanensis TaxID=1268659 RepID=UPI00315CB794